MLTECFLHYLTYCFNCGWKSRFNMSCSIFFCWFSCSSTRSFTTPSAQLQALLNPSLGRYIWPFPSIDLDLGGHIYIICHWIFKSLPEVCSNEWNAVIFPEMTIDWWDWDGTQLHWSRQEGSAGQCSVVTISWLDSSIELFYWMINPAKSDQCQHREILNLRDSKQVSQ